jgi:hypothetical protein
VVGGRYRDGVVALFTVLLCLGVFLLTGGLIFLAVRFSEQWALLVLSRHRPTPIGSRRGNGRVGLEAHTDYGPAGRQIGPVSGEDCTWFHLRLVRKPSRRFGSGDSVPDYDQLLDLASPGWPTIVDPTGRIEIDPRMLDLPTRREPVATETVELTHRDLAPVALPPVVPREALADLRRGERLILTEVRLPRGRRVFALGRRSRGILVPSRGTLSVFTTDSWEEIRAARSADLGIALRAGLAMLAVGVVLTGGSAAAFSALF